MDSNHRFLDVNQASLPLDHGTVLSKWTHPESHRPGSPACDTGIFLLDDEPIVVERKPWDSNPQAAIAATCFQDRLLIRPDDFRLQAAGVGIEPTASWFRARRHYQQQLPRIVLVQRHASSSCGSLKAAGAGIEPADSWFKARHHYQQRRPRIVRRVPCGSRTRLARLEAWNLCRSAKDTCCFKRKERESNPQGRDARPRFERGCHRQSACPSVYKLRRQESNLRQDG